MVADVALPLGRCGEFTLDIDQLKTRILQLERGLPPSAASLRRKVSPGDGHSSDSSSSKGNGGAKAGWKGGKGYDAGGQGNGNSLNLPP